jgi:hypothetical protein
MRAMTVRWAAPYQRRIDATDTATDHANRKKAL